MHMTYIVLQFAFWLKTSQHLLGDKFKIKSANSEIPLHKCRKERIQFYYCVSINQTVMHITGNPLMRMQRQSEILTF